MQSPVNDTCLKPRGHLILETGIVSGQSSNRHQNRMSRPFFLRTYFEVPMGETVHARLPPHSLVIEPLIVAAVEVCVYSKRGEGIEVPMPPHGRVRSHWVLDRSVELVKGWEAFWNSGSWKRGAITIKVARERVDWSNLFSWTEYGGLWSSKRQVLRGNPSAAVAYADKHARGDHAVACLSASNGIECLEWWFDDEVSDAMNLLAQESCRRFVRWIEQGKFTREIVQDRPPYCEIQ